MQLSETKFHLGLSCLERAKIKGLIFTASDCTKSGTVSILEANLIRSGLLSLPSHDLIVHWTVNQCRKLFFLSFFHQTTRKCLFNSFIHFFSPVEGPFLVESGELIFQAQDSNLFFQFTYSPISLCNLEFMGTISFEAERERPLLISTVPLCLMAKNGKALYGSLDGSKCIFKEKSILDSFRFVSNAQEALEGILDNEIERFYSIHSDSTIKVYSLSSACCLSKHKIKEFGLKLCSVLLVREKRLLCLNFGSFINFVDLLTWKESIFLFKEEELNTMRLIPSDVESKIVFAGVFVNVSLQACYLKVFCLEGGKLEFIDVSSSSHYASALFDLPVAENDSRAVVVAKRDFFEFTTIDVAPRHSFSGALWNTNNPSLKTPLSFKLSRFLVFYSNLNFEAFMRDSILHKPHLMGLDQLMEEVCQKLDQQPEQSSLISILAKEEDLIGTIHSVYHLITKRTPLSNIDDFISQEEACTSLLIKLLFLCLVTKGREKLSGEESNFASHLIHQIFLCELKVKFVKTFGFDSTIITSSSLSESFLFEQIVKNCTSQANQWIEQRGKVCFNFIEFILSNFWIVFQNVSVDSLLMIQGIAAVKIGLFKEALDIFSKISPDFSQSSATEFEQEVGDLFFYSGQFLYACYFYRQSKSGRNCQNYFEALMKEGNFDEAVSIALAPNQHKAMDLTLLMELCLDKNRHSYFNPLFIAWPREVEEFLLSSSNTNANKRPQNFHILIQLLQNAGAFQKAASVAFQLSTLEEGEFRIKALELCLELLNKIEFAANKFVLVLNADEKQSNYSNAFSIASQADLEYELAIAKCHKGQGSFEQIFMLCLSSGLFLNAWNLMQAYAKNDSLRDQQILNVAHQTFFKALSHFYCNFASSSNQQPLGVKFQIEQIFAFLDSDEQGQGTFLSILCEKAKDLGPFKERYPISLLKVLLTNQNFDEAYLVAKEILEGTPRGKSLSPAKYCLPWGLFEVLFRARPCLKEHLEVYLNKIRLI